ncbi:MAG: serine/threonine-protein phosphatase, partial [Eubacteriales bacterium]|nr:serine/threonine-protein phosphatase [Eubacteriales bacterium]
EYAGIGMTLNFGWTRDKIADFLSANYLPDTSAKSTAGLLADECNRLYGGHPGDDTTIAVLRIRQRQPVNLVIGPPAKKEDDTRMMNLFFAKEGIKIVCGGTTSQVASRHLHKPILATLDYPDPDVPPTSKIEGVDLVTEGVITLSKVLTYAQDFLKTASLAPVWAVGKDGASQIARELFENATDIHFFVGQAINPAHQNPDLPITFGVKQQLIQSLAECLEKMGKHIRLSYF